MSQPHTAICAKTSAQTGTVLASLIVTLFYSVVTNLRTLTMSGWNFESFRSLGAGDQLSYLAIVTNVSQGKSADVEPFTETGTIFYPRAYYVALGNIARLLHLSPTFTWWLVGTLMQALLVFVLAMVLANFARRWWGALLAPLPLLAGTFAEIFRDRWLWPFESHAVLWGPFATLYTLNGEAAGLVLLSLVGLFVTVQLLRDTPTAGGLSVLIPAGIVIGLLANIHTYVFFLAVFLVAYSVAVFGLRTIGTWKAVAVSGLLLIGVFVYGPSAANHNGALATLALGLAPAIPGITLTAVRHFRATVLPLTAIAVAASPTLVATAMGIATKDDFLIYRTASNVDLGIGISAGTIAASGLLALIAIVTFFGYSHKSHLFFSVGLGVLVVGALLSTNDRWGANQEPYRFWISSFMVGTVVLFPMAFYALRGLVDDAADKAKTPWRPKSVAVASIVVLIVQLVSLGDFVGFVKATPQPIAFDGPRPAAIMSIAHFTNNDMIVVDDCVDPKIYKALTGNRVTNFNYGMAWPSDFTNLDAINNSVKNGPLDVAAMRSADVSYVLTDSSCDAPWKAGIDDELTVAARVVADDGKSLILYRLK